MSVAYEVSRFNRDRKWRIFQEIIHPDSRMTILDVGFTEREFSDIDNYIEKHYPYPHNLTALGIDTPELFTKRYPDVKVVQYEGSNFPFNCTEFDCCWSNAVLEHVGNREKQINFLKEITRVSKVAFITTPNKLFPVEVHTHTLFLHYLPKKIFHRYLKFVHKEWAAGDYMNLLSLSGLKSLLKDAGIFNYKIIKNKLLFFTLDFIIYISVK